MQSLQEYIDNRDEAMLAYSLSGETVDKARYNNSVKLLRNYVLADGIEMDDSEIDIITYERASLARLKEVFKFEDSGYDENVDDEY